MAAIMSDVRPWSSASTEGRPRAWAHYEGEGGGVCERSAASTHLLTCLLTPPLPSPHLAPITLCKCSCACSLLNHTAVASGDWPNKLSSGFMAESRGSNGWAWTPVTGPTPSRVGTCVCVCVCVYSHACSRSRRPPADIPVTSMTRDAKSATTTLVLFFI